MNDEEKKALIASIKAAMAEAAGGDINAIKGMLGRLTELEQLVAERGAGAPAIRGLGIADPFNADSFKQRANLVKEGQNSTGRIHLPEVGIKGVKALVNMPAGGTVGFATQAQRGPTLEPVIPPLTLVDVLPSTPVSSDRFEYVQLSRTSNAGIQQNEGDQKPQTEFSSDLLVAEIATIAHWTQASRQVLSDNAQLSGTLSRILAIDVIAKYEALLINGNGTTDKIHGLVPQATPFSHTATPKPDRISEALAAMWVAGYVGNIVVMSPFDWHEISTERASGDGQYVAGGWSNPAAPNVWNTPVVRAAGLAQGTSLVIDTRYVTMLDRQQVATMVSTEDRDNLIKNLVTLLAEMRGGLAIYDTAAVTAVDIGST